MKNPSPLDIFHLLTAIEMMTNMSIENKSITEQAIPSANITIKYIKLFNYIYTWQFSSCLTATSISTIDCSGSKNIFRRYAMLLMCFAYSWHWTNLWRTFKTIYTLITIHLTVSLSALEDKLNFHMVTWFDGYWRNNHRILNLIQVISDEVNKRTDQPRDWKAAQASCISKRKWIY